MDKKRELYIPVNSLDEEDFISGIGKIELTVIFIALIVSILIGGAYSIAAKNTINAVMFVVIIVVSAVLIVRRDRYNENLIKKIQVVIEYIKSQKRFEYLYKNIYESTVGDIDEEDE